MSAIGPGPAQRTAGRDVRAVRAAVLLGTAVVSLSEALGGLDAFARGPIVAAWSLAAMLSGVFWARRRRRDSAARALGVPRDPAGVIAVAAVALVLTACLGTALLAPVSNGDALGYHLPRVRHWIQNHSFAHYPTASLRQISFPPGGSYLVAHLRLLTGGDRLASLPQWLALLGCVLVTASLGRRLGGPRAALPTALACATIPMAVLQASNPQTDLVAAFWLACLVHLVVATPRYRAAEVGWLGLALGMGLCTKPTLDLYALPFLAILALRAGRRGWRAALVVPAATVLVALLPCLPNAIRNERTFGTPLGSDVGAALRRHDLRVVASNVLRHGALAWPSAAIWRGVSWAHAHLLHVDASDPRTTFPETAFDGRFLSPLRAADENFAASPLHVALALVAGAVALRRRRRGWRAALRGQLAVAVAAAFVLHCALLCWQPWANRLLLPLVVLAAPLVGWLLAEVSVPVRASASLLLGTIGILYATGSVRHPLFPSSFLARSRVEVAFADYDRGLSAQYATLARRAAADGCARFELASTEFAPEYLLWITFDAAHRPFALGAATVDNPSRAAGPEAAAAAPCARISLQRDGGVRYQPLAPAGAPGP